MEKVEGESLASRWLSLTTQEVADLMTQIAEMEQKIFSFRFSRVWKYIPQTRSGR